MDNPNVDPLLLKDKPTSFWGKIALKGVPPEVVEWHPLIDHCADVAACAATLLALPTWRRRLARLRGGSDLDEVTTQRLGVLAAIHDLGKFNLGFQARGRSELGASAGHVKEALAAINAGELPSVEPLGQWGDGTTGLLVAAICHHGRPYSLESAGRFEPALWTARAGLDPREGVSALLSATKDWFPRAFGAEGSVPDSPAFEHAYAGLVMLADWLGSDERIFRYAEPGDADRFSFARDAAERFLGESWIAVDDGRRKDRAQEEPFLRIAPARTPRATQNAITRLPVCTTSSITILESETGSGKTEAALARFLQLYVAGEVDGLYFALPTRTAATQMHRRVLEAARHAFADPPPVVLAVPGYLRVDDVTGRRLPDFEVQWPDDEADRFRYRAWAGESTKRYLAGCIVVGTVDQVLLSSLRVRHAHLRATALYRQLLVVDEVHASDAYMTCVLEDVLARHIEAGGHALLLSATLGGEARTRLLHPGERVCPPSLDHAKRTPYPLISQRIGRGRVEVLVPGSSGGGDEFARTAKVEAMPWLEDAQSIAQAALNAARLGAKVLVVRNTVLDCLATQRCMEKLATLHGGADVLFVCRGQIAPHHSRFARPDREALDGALEDQFGQIRNVGGCVVVATQTVQQSLDIDADLLLTDLCPMDVLLQRLGRLHRHSRTRPRGFEAARAAVIVPANRNLGALLNDKGRARHHHGLGTVYPDLRMLEATWRKVEQNSTWRIPEMNRTLVEDSVHSTALQDVAQAGGSRWEAHAQEAVGVERGETRQAYLNLIDWHVPYSSTTFSDDERIPTRLGEADRRVRFETALTSPFKLSVDELIMPARWAIGIPVTEETATSVVSSEGQTRFQFGGRPFLYDRHGLRPSTQDDDSSRDDDDGP